MKSKLKFGIWYGTQTWHIVKIKTIPQSRSNLNTVTICNDRWLDHYPSKDYTLPDGLQIKDALKYFDLNHICKKCIKMVDIEDVKTYIIYHKLGIKQ